MQKYAIWTTAVIAIILLAIIAFNSFSLGESKTGNVDNDTVQMSDDGEVGPRSMEAFAPPLNHANNSTNPEEKVDQNLDLPSRTSRSVVKPMISGRWTNYKTRISEGWNTEQTFGDRFVIIRMGCGTGCSLNIVGDHRTGRIYDLGLGGEEMQILDLQFNNQSNLIRAQWQDSDTDSCISQTFLWTEVKLNQSGDRSITPRSEGVCSNPK